MHCPFKINYKLEISCVKYYQTLSKLISLHTDLLLRMSSVSKEVKNNVSKSYGNFH